MDLPPREAGEGDRPEGGGGGGANASGPILKSDASGEPGADPSTSLRLVPLPSALRLWGGCSGGRLPIPTANPLISLTSVHAIRPRRTIFPSPLRTAPILSPSRRTGRAPRPGDPRRRRDGVRAGSSDGVSRSGPAQAGGGAGRGGQAERPLAEGATGERGLRSRSGAGFAAARPPEASAGQARTALPSGGSRITDFAACDGLGQFLTPLIRLRPERAAPSLPSRPVKRRRHVHRRSSCERPERAAPNPSA
jgi:hypothetical protein